MVNAFVGFKVSRKAVGGAEKAVAFVFDISVSRRRRNGGPAAALLHVGIFKKIERNGALGFGEHGAVDINRADRRALKHKSRPDRLAFAESHGGEKPLPVGGGGVYGAKAVPRKGRDPVGYAQPEFSVRKAFGLYICREGVFARRQGQYLIKGLIRAF